MHLILKPESRSYVEIIERRLAENLFQVRGWHPIGNWRELAKKLYSPQATSSEEFKLDLDCYLWLSDYFFGNHSLMVDLEEGEDLEESLRDLHQFKTNVRKEFPGKDERLRILVDRSKFHHNGYKETRDESDWDDFFFKYIHTSDPDLGEYLRENQILREEGIFDRSISNTELGLIKRVGSFITSNGGYNE